jgi:hypothetical protein
MRKLWLRILSRLRARRAKIGLIGRLEVRDNRTRELILDVPNIIVNLGLANVADLLTNGATEPLSRGCIGTGAVAADAADTNLGAQVDYQIATATTVQTSVAGDTAQFVSVHTAPVGGWAITEYGIKTAAGILFNRVVFAAINLAQGNELEFTYKVQVTKV